MEILYINLDSASERKTEIEQSFSKSRFPHAWSLRRMPAVNADSDIVQNTGGPVSTFIKANWLSHTRCMQYAIVYGNTNPLMIVEDDTIFCEKTAHMVDVALALLQGQEWDILLLDFLLSSAVDYPWFYKLRASCSREGKLQLLPLKDFRHPFAGAAAYIVNPKSLLKFHAFCNIGSIPVAFDLYLQYLVTSGFLSGFVTYPFLTTVSTGAENSQVDHPMEHLDEVHYMNRFRQMIWIGADCPASTAGTEGEAWDCDVSSFSEVFLPLLKKQMHWHY